MAQWSRWLERMVRLGFDLPRRKQPLAYVIEVRHKCTTALALKPAPQLVATMAQSLPQSVHVNECIHRAVQHGNRPNNKSAEIIIARHVLLGL